METENPQPAGQGCRLELKGRVDAVVSSPKATRTQKSFLLRGSQPFLLRLSTDWMRPTHTKI